jgi:hypothetical protein
MFVSLPSAFAKTGEGRMRPVQSSKTANDLRLFANVVDFIVFLLMCKIRNGLVNKILLQRWGNLANTKEGKSTKKASEIDQKCSSTEGVMHVKSGKDRGQIGQNVQKRGGVHKKT